MPCLIFSQVTHKKMYALVKFKQPAQLTHSVYSFPVATEPSYDKFSGFKQHKFITFQF